MGWEFVSNAQLRIINGINVVAVYYLGSADLYVLMVF
jgi:hypothetical protein